MLELLVRDLILRLFHKGSLACEIMYGCCSSQHWRQSRGWVGVICSQSPGFKSRPSNWLSWNCLHLEKFRLVNVLFSNYLCRFLHDAICLFLYALPVVRHPASWFLLYLALPGCNIHTSWLIVSWSSLLPPHKFRDWIQNSTKANFFYSFTSQYLLMILPFDENT